MIFLSSFGIIVFLIVHQVSVRLVYIKYVPGVQVSGKSTPILKSPKLDYQTCHRTGIFQSCFFSILGFIEPLAIFDIWILLKIVSCVILFLAMRLEYLRLKQVSTIYCSYGTFVCIYFQKKILQTLPKYVSLCFS